MTWTATPWVEYDGQRVQTGDVESNWTSLVVPEISFTWGRNSLLEHADPGSASITLACRVTASEILRDPQGREVRVGYTYKAPGYEGDRVMFRGRVDSVDIEHFRTAKGEDIFLANIVAPGRLTEVARIKLTDDNTVRIAEYFQVRRDWLATHLGSTTAGYIGGGGTQGDGQGFDDYVAETDYKDADLLSSIQDLYTTSAEAVTYDPQRDIVDGMGLWYDARTTPALFLVWRDGKVAVSPFADGHGTYDAGQALMSSASVNQDQTISRLSIEGYVFDNSEPVGQKWKDGYTLYTDLAGAPKGGMEFKPNTLAYKNLGTKTDSRYQSLSMWEPIVSSARLFTPPPITQQHRNGWLSFADMTNALSGKEVRETNYIMGSVYSAISTAPPFCRPIGGTVRYTTSDAGKGFWETTLTLAAAELNRALNPITLAELNPNAAPATELRRNLWRGSALSIDNAAIASTTAGSSTAQTATGLAITTGPPAAGAYSLTYTNAAFRVPVEPGKAYSWRIPLKNNGTTPFPVAFATWISGSTTGDTSKTASFALAAGEQRDVVIENFIAKPDAVDIRFSLYYGASASKPVAGSVLELLDRITLTETTTAPAPFNGSTISTDPGIEYAWTGTPNASASIQQSAEGFSYGDFHDSLSLLDLGNAEEGI